MQVECVTVNFGRRAKPVALKCMGLYLLASPFGPHPLLSTSIKWIAKTGTESDCIRSSFFSVTAEFLVIIPLIFATY